MLLNFVYVKTFLDLDEAFTCSSVETLMYIAPRDGEEVSGGFI